MRTPPTERMDSKAAAGGNKRARVGEATAGREVVAAAASAAARTERKGYDEEPPLHQPLVSEAATRWRACEPVGGARRPAGRWDVHASYRFVPYDDSCDVEEIFNLSHLLPVRMEGTLELGRPRAPVRRLWYQGDICDYGTSEDGPPPGHPGAPGQPWTFAGPRPRSDRSQRVLLGGTVARTFTMPW